MQHITNNLRHLSLTIEPFSVNFIKLQTLRWYRPRKPLWMGTAKSKLFRVPVRPVLPEDEMEELKRLSNNYRTQIKSLRRFLTYKHSILLLAKSDTEQLEKAFEEDFARCKEINDKWNEEVRVSREKRVAEQLEKDIEFAKNRLINEHEKQKLIQEQAEEIVRREKEVMKGFITEENLDAAIEYAINNPIDYNFAIDLEGNRIEGREAKPEEPAQKIIVKQ